MRAKLNVMTAVLFFAVAFTWGPGALWAAGYPDKAINIIVPFAPGAGTDLDARGLTPYLEKYLGVPVKIENIKGAEGKLGITRLWRSKPDGYTLMIHTVAETLMGDIVLPNVEYRTIDLTHIGTFTRGNSIIVDHVDNWKTFPELAKTGRERALIGGNPGKGSPSHFNAMLLMKKAGVKVNWVPFSGAGEALTALAGKHTEFSIHTSPSILSLVKAGKIRPVVVLSEIKDNVFPDAPLAKEVGYDVEFLPVLRGLDGPPNMPEDVQQALDKALAQAVKDPAFVAWAQNRMSQVYYLNREEYNKLIKSHLKELQENKDILDTM